MKPVSKIALSLFFICCLTSCNRVLMAMFGIRQPKPKTDQEVLAFIKAKQLDYDYVIRPRTDSELLLVTKYMKMSFSTLAIYDNNGNEVQNTNDSTCHMKLRSQIDEMLRHAPTAPGLIVKNNKWLIDSSCRCLSCVDDRPLYGQELKPYVIYFTLATFIPIKKRFSDLDYVSELRQEGLRDKVTIVLLDLDIHE